MPIFVSRFSPGRVSGANLQQVRTPANQTTGRADAGTARRELQTERNRQTEDTRQNNRAGQTLENLLARTQLGQRLSERLQAVRNERAETQTEMEADASRAEQAETRAAENRTPRALPGVGALRTRADDDVERPGRLTRAPANPVREQQLDRFAQLRALRTNAPGDTQRAREALQADVPGLNREADARIRLVAANARAQRGAALATPAETEATAEEISQANTTPEIRENLRQDTREVAQGLSRDAIRQTQQTTQRVAQNAVRANEGRREDVQQESRAEVRELEVDARQLERELQQTQRDIRQQRTRAQRAGSAVSSAPAATAAAIGTNVNILAG